MTLFCLCDFRLSDYFQWSDLWSLVGAGIGAYLGFVAASQIYKKERKDKAEEERQLDQHLFSTTKLLIERASLGGRQAESSFRELLKKYEEQPIWSTQAAHQPEHSADHAGSNGPGTPIEFVQGRARRSARDWRLEVETWRFCDGLIAQTKFGEAVCVGLQENLHAHSGED